MGVTPLCKIEDEVWADKGEPKETKHLEEPSHPTTKEKEENHETSPSFQGFAEREDPSFVIAVIFGLAGFFQQVKGKNAVG